jgi:hypothetical protein
MASGWYTNRWKARARARDGTKASFHPHIKRVASRNAKVVRPE